MPRDKESRLRAALALYPTLRSLDLAPLRAAHPQTAYRTRAKLVVAHDPLRIGLFAPGTHDVVDAAGFEMLRPVLRETLDGLRAVAAAHASHPAVRALAALDLRETLADPADPRVLLTWILGARTRARLDDTLAEAITAAAPRVITLAESTQAPGSPQLLGRNHRIVRGPSLVRDRLAPDAPWFLAAPGAFLQTHRPQAATIQKRLTDDTEPGSVSPPPRVLELYAGAGSLALALAARGARVTMVESFPEAVSAARAAAAEQSLAVEAIAGDAAVETRRLAAAGARFDAVVVNPPRRGLEPDVRAAVAALGPETIAYVSCSPETLARDLDHLRRLGYAPRRALEPFDMIPGTDEVETLVFLGRTEIPLPHVLYDDEELIAVDKPPHEPTTPHGEHATSLLARVQRLPGAAAAVPLHRLDHGTSGVCLFARRADLAGAWAAALNADDAEKVYLAAVRGRVHDKGTINRALDERGSKKPARTRYRRTDLLGGHHSRLEVRPDHGRKHQIRRHLASIGHPILGDARYGHPATNQFVQARWGLDRPFLHCAEIALNHPKTGARVTLRAEFPPDLQAVLVAAMS